MTKQGSQGFCKGCFFTISCGTSNNGVPQISVRLAASRGAGWSFVSILPICCLSTYRRSSCRVHVLSIFSQSKCLSFPDSKSAFCKMTKQSADPKLNGGPSYNFLDIKSATRSIHFKMQYTNYKLHRKAVYTLRH